MLNLLGLTDEQREELIGAVKGAIGDFRLTMEFHRVMQTRIASAKEREANQLARIADAMEQRKASPVVLVPLPGDPH